MICPRCSIPLIERFADDVPLDKCPRCKGVWFDMAEFDWMRAQGRGRQRRAFEAPPTTQRSAAERGDEELVCPRCGGDLLTTPSADDPALLVKACLSCYGEWIDGSELDRAATKGLWHKFTKLFSDIV